LYPHDHVGYKGERAKHHLLTFSVTFTYFSSAPMKDLMLQTVASFAAIELDPNHH
jgi:hypothetical protein